MEGLDNREEFNKGLETKQGERRRLSSNNVNSNRSPCLDLNDNSSDIAEADAIERLAEILAEIYRSQEHEQKEGGNILPSVG